jgi:hypothetical protein
MSRLFKILLASILALTILACGLISGPISDIENAASTAESFASALPVETLESLTTAIPIQTLEALSSAVPDVGNYFDPTGTPVDEWNGIPVMPEATVGEEFGDSTYGFTAPVSSSDVQAFYNQKLEELGWMISFSLPVTDEGGILLYQNGDELLTITITPDQNDSNSVDVILQK